MGARSRSAKLPRARTAAGAGYCLEEEHQDMEGGDRPNPFRVILQPASVHLTLAVATSAAYGPDKVPLSSPPVAIGKRLFPFSVRLATALRLQVLSQDGSFRKVKKKMTVSLALLRTV